MKITVMRRQLVALCFAYGGLPMSASGAEAATSPQAVSPASVEIRVQALLTKVKGSLRPLKGGTFDMGDWGNGAGQYYDIDTYSRPLHKVTLDGFSMMAYKVTYEDFDVFTDATGKQRINMDALGSRDRAPKRSHQIVGKRVSSLFEFELMST